MPTMHTPATEDLSSPESTFSMTTMFSYSYSSSSRAHPAARLPFSFGSLELLQRRRAKISVEPLAIDRNRPVFCQVCPRGNAVVLITLVAFQFSEFQFLCVILYKICVISGVLLRYQKYVYVRPARSFKSVSRSTNEPSAC